MNLFNIDKERVKEYTLMFVFGPTRREILLGMKKRGFGVGKWNGFGGKIELTDASPEAAAVRELKEESGFDVDVSQITRIGCNYYEFDPTVEKKIMKVWVFYCDILSAIPSDAERSKKMSEIVETEEMRPNWFLTPEDLDDLFVGVPKSLPFDKMWEDDKFWMPVFLNAVATRTAFCGHFIFSDFSTITAHQIEMFSDSHNLLKFIDNLQMCDFTKKLEDIFSREN